MDKEALRFLLRPYLPHGLSRESMDVLAMTVEEIAEEDPDPEEWEEGVRDLIADDVGLLDLEDEGEEDPELADTVDKAAHALREALFTKQ